MIESDYRYRVFIGSEGMFVPFQGRILRKPAPGGWDHACRQDVASLSSHRPVWHYILDRELTEVARMVRAFQQWGPRSILQCRVDGVCAVVPRRDHKRALEIEEETWAAGRKFKVERIGADHRTLIPPHHQFSPTCEPEEPPKAGARMGSEHSPVPWPKEAHTVPAAVPTRIGVVMDPASQTGYGRLIGSVPGPPGWVVEAGAER